jgi:predicted nucleotidyltransferase
MQPFSPSPELVAFKEYLKDEMSDVTLTLEELLLTVKIEDTKVLNLILVGSRLHGTASASSDYDFIMIVQDDTILPEGKKVERDNLDVTIFTRSEYEESLRKGEEWQTIETLWVPPSFRWKFTEDFLPFYNSDLSRLRVAVSSIASKGHAYAKILVNKEGNFRLAKKNIAHEIRNLRLGIQIATHGSIIDYTETKEILAQIMQDPAQSWDEINERWGSIAMQYQKDFISRTPEKIKIPKKRQQKIKKPYIPLQKADTSDSLATPSMETEPAWEVITD